MDAYEAADHVLPLDGPHQPDQVIAAARLIGELVRRLNRATASGHVLPWPGDLYGVLGGITEAVAGLAQLLDQLADRADAFAEHPRLTHTHHPAEARPAATQAADLLRRANTARGELHRHLAAAWAKNGPLGLQAED
ncbi:MAG: hypothetical protein IRY92_00555 [Dactylosporangium sp.]|nr:hypothetical protein [Dactylosporangium sp.]